MSIIEFTKMHGLGNDYVYINCLNSYRVGKPSELQDISDSFDKFGWYCLLRRQK